MTYLPGETVSVTLTGKVGKVVPGAEEGDWDELSLDLEDDQGGMAVRVPLGWANARIERLVPAAGMPKVDEVWQDGKGRRYLVVGDVYGNPELMSCDARRFSVADVQQTWPPLTPLIQDPDPEPAEDEEAL